MRAFVINLDSRSDRLATFHRRNAWMFRQSGGSLFCERFPAIDGRRCDKPEFWTPAQRGCAASHIELWLRAAEWSVPTLICEDDAQVLEANYTAEMADVPLLVVGYNWDAPLVVSYGLGAVAIRHDQAVLRRCYENNADGIAPSKSQLMLWPLVACFGTPAYIVTPPAARWLLDNACDFQNVTVQLPGAGFAVPNTGIDTQLNLHYGALGARVLFPPMAFTENRR